MSDLFAQTLGVAAAVCSIVSFAPQTWKIWRTRDASSVSLKTYSLTVAAFALWIGYGVAITAWPIVVSNAFALLMAALTLAMKWRFGTGRRRA